jgi:hypothetical protein
MLKVAFYLFTALLVVALYKSPSLPEAAAIASQLSQEPLQEAVVPAPFKTDKNGVTYTIEPSHRYEIHGLVVSKYNTDTWWGWAHKAWNDHLNVTDLCVVWGTNALSGGYHNLSFSSGQWTCNVETSSEAAWQAFDMTKISNNHLLTDNPQLATKLKNIRIGDQIHLTGHLANYKHFTGNGFARGTSTVRTDTGNGACETIFVSEVNVLRSAPSLWRSLIWLAAVGMLVAIGLGLLMPHRPSS